MDEIQEMESSMSVVGGNTPRDQREKWMFENSEVAVMGLKSIGKRKMGWDGERTRIEWCSV